MPDPIRGMFDDIVQGTASTAAPIAGMFDDIVAGTTPPRRPVTPAVIPAGERAGLRPQGGPTILETGADVARQGMRGLAEAGYATAQGAVNLAGMADRAVRGRPAPTLTQLITGERPKTSIDLASEAVRQSRQEMREFYGDPETGLGTAANIGGNIIGSGAQFMVPGTALSRVAQISRLPAGAATAMRFLANPLGGTGVRAAAGRVVGGAALNTPLNAAIAASPEDASATGLGELTNTNWLRRAGQNFPAAFAVETGVDLLGNAVVEGIGAGVRRFRRPKVDVPTPPATGTFDDIVEGTDAASSRPDIDPSGQGVPDEVVPPPVEPQAVTPPIEPDIVPPVSRETVPPVEPPEPRAIDPVASEERAALAATERPDYWTMEMDQLQARVPRAVPTSVAKMDDDALTALTVFRSRRAQDDMALAARIDEVEVVLESNNTGRKIGYENAKRLFGTAEDARKWSNVSEEQIGALQELGFTPQDVRAMYKARARLSADEKALGRLNAEMEARGLSMADNLDDSFDPALLSPMRRGGKPKQAKIVSGPGVRAPETPGKIDADEMAARRDELGAPKQDIPGTNDPDQGAFFNPARGAGSPPPPPPAGPTAASPSPAPAPKPRLGDRLTPKQEMASEIAASALGGVAGSAAAGEDHRGVGFVLGALAGYGGARGTLAGIKGVAKNAAIREGVQTLRQINLDMMRAAGVSARTGRSPSLGRTARGWFRPDTEAIRLMRMDHLDTGAHEIGHYVSKRFFGNPAGIKSWGDLSGPKIPLSMAERRELVEAGERLYGGRKPTAGYGEEGIAEFFKFYVTNPARAKAEFPLTFNKFMQALEAPVVPGASATMKQVLDQAQSQYAKWKASPAYQRVSALVSVNEQATVLPTLTDLRRIVEDDLFAAKQATREMRALGAKLQGDEIDPYQMMILSRGSAGEAARALEDGIVINGKKVAGGLERTLEAVRDRTQDFRMYLVAKRALDDLIPRGIDPGIGAAEAEALVAQFEADFLPHAEKIWAFQRAKIRMLKSVGLLTKEQAGQIIEMNKHHVPFKRVFEPDEVARGGGAGAGKAKNSSGVTRIKGSARQIIDPLEEIVRDTYQVYRRVREHDAARRLVQMALRTEGGSRWFERVPAPKVPQSFRVTKETIEQLVDLGIIKADEAWQFESLLQQGRLDGFLEGFTDAQRAGMAEGRDMVFPMLDEEGKRIWVEVKDPQVYEAFLGMNTEQQSALERFIGKWPKWAQAPLIPAKATARTLRAGATLTLEFIARNPLRDAWGAMVRTQADRMIVAPGEHLVRGVYSLLKKDVDYDAWLRSGGANAAMVSGDRSVYQKSLRDLQATAAERGWYLVRHPVDFLRALSEISENATRLGEFKMVRQEAMKRGLMPRQANLTAAAAARDITVDFAKAGQGVREANKIVAFLNAYVQGNVNLAKDLVKRPGTVLPRIFVGITLPSLALEALFADSETYQEVPDWVKRTAWVIPMGDGPDAPYIAIPKPFELGTLFGTIPQRILNHAIKDDPKQLERVRNDLVKAFTPPVVPTMAAPLIENYANRSLFTDRPIVPRDKEGEEPFAQAGPRTGETARLIGQLTNTSPAKLENLIRGWGGGLGAMALQVPDAAISIGREKMGMEPLKTSPNREREGVFGVPGVRAFVKPAPTTDAESIERFYGDRDSAERKRQTWKGLQQEGRFGQAAKYLADNLADILAMGSAEDFGQPGVLRDVSLKMSDLREMRRTILSSGLPRTERDAALRGIEQAMKGLSQGGNAAMQALSTALRP